MNSAPVMAAQHLIQRTLPTLERRVDEALGAKPEAIDIVLTHIQSVDSVGLNWLLLLQGRLESQNIRLRLVDPSPLMADVLIATRLDSRFTMEAKGAATAEAAAAVPPGAGAGGGNGR